MRLTWGVLGAAALAAYAVLGAFLMNDWAVVAASGLPLDATVATMEAAGQPYSSVAGVLFAVMGILLAAAWAWATVSPRMGLPAWGSLVAWSGIVACGAPAYFFGSFGNLNSVGDTFADWNMAAAWAVEAPLYIASAVAFVLGVGTLVTAAVRSVRRSRVPRPAAALPVVR